MGSWEKRVSSVLRAFRLDSIKNKIVVFALLATLIPSLSMAWISYTQNTRSLNEKIAEELLRVSSQASREIDLWIKERLWEVRVFSTSFVVRENVERIIDPSGTSIEEAAALASLDDYLRSVQERFPDHDELLIIHPDGHIVASSTGETSTIDLPLESWNDVRQGTAIVRDPHGDGVLRRQSAIIVQPIYTADGAASRLLAGMAAKVSFASVGETLKALTPGESGQVYLVNRKGGLITGTGVGAREPRSASPDEALPILAAEGDWPVVGTFEKVPRLDWTIVAEIPQQEAFAQIARLRNLTALIVVILLVGVGSIAYALAQIIIRPLDRLAAGAAHVAAGDLAVDLPVMGGGEVGYLTRVFNNMVARLREGRQELDAINDTLSQQNEELALRSITDVLTGLNNRRHLMETLEQEAGRSRRRGGGFAILMIDVDHFKKFNDTFGHLAGDNVLIKLASILQESARDIDSAARYGGEEFVVMLPDTSLKDAAQVAERIRTRLTTEHFGTDDAYVTVTLSIGVAEFPQDGDSPEAVLAKADSALYHAKRRGRDRVVATSRRRVSRETKAQA